MGKLLTFTVPVTAFAQNCTLLFDSDTHMGVIVDPGGSLPLIVKKIAELKLTITAVWLTHAHIDHIGAAPAIQKIFGVPVIGPHIGDLALFEQIPQQARLFDWPEQVESFKPDRWLANGETLAFDHHYFEVLHTPGHTKGHVAYFNKHEKIIMVGDVLFHGTIGRTDLPGGDYDVLMQSISTVILPLGDDVAFIPGHGPRSTIAVERKTNPFLVNL